MAHRFCIVDISGYPRSHRDFVDPSKDRRSAGGLARRDGERHSRIRGHQCPKPLQAGVLAQRIDESVGSAAIVVHAHLHLIDG